MKNLSKNLFKKNKQGQGLIMGLVMGIAALIIAVIIAFVIVSTIATVESQVATTSPFRVTVINESDSYINGTDYTLAHAGVVGFTNPVIVHAYNMSEDEDLIIQHFLHHQYSFFYTESIIELELLESIQQQQSITQLESCLKSLQFLL